MLQLRRRDQADGDQAGTAELDFVEWAKGTAQVVLGRARTVHQCRNGGRPLVGVVGIADLVDCVRKHDSKWYAQGHYAFVLTNARPLPFVRWKGAAPFAQRRLG